MHTPPSSWPGSTRPSTYLGQEPRPVPVDARIKSGHDGREGVAASLSSRHPEKARRPDSPIPRKPDWLRVRAPGSPEYHATRRLMRELALNTVCEEAACPNIGECWKQKHATVMILGRVCTRACTFCNVATGRPDLLDPHEPGRVAEAVAALGLSHVVVTSVDRDDLADGGAGHFVRTIEAIRAAAPATTIEVLTAVFLKKDGAIEAVG